MAIARGDTVSIKPILLSISLRISDCISLARDFSSLRGLIFNRRQRIITLLLVQYLSPDTSLVAASIGRRTC